MNRQQWDKYVRVFGPRSACYTSLYSFDSIDSARVDYTTVRYDRAWWDFDSTVEYGIEEVKADVATLLSRLQGDVRLVATGRGFHVHQLFKEPLRGKAWDYRLKAYENHMARNLKTLDGVGYAEKLTRIPGTYNPKRQRWAIPIDPMAFRASPQSYSIPKTPHKGMFAHDPFNGQILNGFDFKTWSASNRIEDVVEVSKEYLGDISEAAEIPMIPCLERAVNVQNPSHHVRVALVQYMADMLRDFADPATLTTEDKKAIEDSIFDYIKGLDWRDFKPSRSRQGIRTNINYKNAPSCSWFIKRNLCVGKCWRYDGTAEPRS